MTSETSKGWIWVDRGLMLTVISIHTGAVFDHFTNLVRASLANWIPLLIVLVVYLSFWALYIFRISRHPTSGFKAIARVLLILTSIGVILMFLPPGTMVTELPPELQVLVADAENKTGDSRFPVDVVRKTLTIALKESSQIGIMPEKRLQDTLRRMEKSPSERISIAIGRDVCAREGVGLLIAPAVSKMGAGYVLEAAVLNPKTGQVLYETKVDATSVEGVTGGVGTLAKDLRNKFGESSWHIFRTAKPWHPLPASLRLPWNCTLRHKNI
jgi:hypothetical protein